MGKVPIANCGMQIGKGVDRDLFHGFAFVDILIGLVVWISHGASISLFFCSCLSQCGDG